MRTSIWFPRLWVLFLAFCLLASSCAGGFTPVPPHNGAQPTLPSQPTSLPPLAGEKVLQSKLARIEAPGVSAEDLAALVQGNNAFAMALYQQLRSRDGNLFYSPYSISLALAMTYAGASGDTEKQMAQALHFSLPQERLHPAMNALDQEIASYGKNAASQDPGFRLDVANSIWGQQDFSFLPAYLDLLAQDYGAGLRLVDFRQATEASRKVINDWVEQQTQGKIQELFPQGSIDAMTRLVLANAIYFKAAWEKSFAPKDTQNGSFSLPDGSTISVPMMSTASPSRFLYLQGSNYQAVGLPYAGSPIVMAILMPTGGNFSDFEAGLTDAQLNSILAGMKDEHLNLSMPKFKVESEINLKSTLISLGMTDAFLSSNADFAGMDGQKDLFIGAVLHKAYVNVDENGTEAAAATGVVMEASAMPAQPLTVTIDHPFLFLLFDPETKTILFMGRVLDPSK